MMKIFIPNEIFHELLDELPGTRPYKDNEFIWYRKSGETVTFLTEPTNEQQQRDTSDEQPVTTIRYPW